MFESKNAKWVYNSKLMKLLQIAAPVAIRFATNYSAGNALYTDMEMPVLIAAMSCTQLSGNANVSNMLFLNPVKHQLMSWLIYGALSGFGYNKDLTIFASRMCATLLYSSRFSDRAEDKMGFCTVIPDISTCILGLTGLSNVLGKNYFMPLIVATAFRSGVSILAAKYYGKSEDDKRMEPYILSATLPAWLYDSAMQIGVHSPIIACIDDSLKYFSEGAAFVASEAAKIASEYMSASL